MGAQIKVQIWTPIHSTLTHSIPNKAKGTLAPERGWKHYKESPESISRICPQESLPEFIHRARAKGSFPEFIPRVQLWGIPMRGLGSLLASVVLYNLA